MSRTCYRNVLHFDQARLLWRTTFLATITATYHFYDHSEIIWNTTYLCCTEVFFLFDDICLFFFSPLLNKVNATAWRLHIFFFLVPGEYFPILYVLKMPTWPFLRKRPWCDSLQRPHQLHFNFPLVICDRLNVLHHGCNSILVGSRVCCRVKLANRMHMLVLGDPLAAWIALPLCF